MSAEPFEPLAVFVLVVSHPNRPADVTGPRIVAAVEAAGHEVVDRFVVPPQADHLHGALNAVAEHTGAVLLIVGGIGLGVGDVVPEVLRSRLGRRVEGYAARFHQLVTAPAALLERPVAGYVGQAIVWALPSSPELAGIALEQIILPALPAMALWAPDQVAYAAPEPFAAPPPAPEISELAPALANQEAELEAPVTEEDPTPSGTLGHLGRHKMSVAMAPKPDAAPPKEEDQGLPGAGWKRAVFEVGGEVHFDRREEIPQPVERLAPLLDVLHQAGETAVLELPSGVKYSLWGYPDLRRPTSKVLALGWGKPLCELLALHRYPTQTGTCLSQEHGLMPGAASDLSGVCEAITGRAPKDAQGELFAISGEEVWWIRGRQVTRWDGRREHQEGSPTQVLASLALRWSAR